MKLVTFEAMRKQQARTPQTRGKRGWLLLYRTCLCA